MDTLKTLRKGDVFVFPNWPNNYHKCLGFRNPLSFYPKYRCCVTRQLFGAGLIINRPCTEGTFLDGTGTPKEVPVIIVQTTLSFK